MAVDANPNLLQNHSPRSLGNLNTRKTKIVGLRVMEMAFLNRNPSAHSLYMSGNREIAGILEDIWTRREKVGEDLVKPGQIWRRCEEIW